MLLSELLDRVGHLMATIGDIDVDQAIVNDVLFRTDEHTSVQLAFRTKDKAQIVAYQDFVRDRLKEVV